MPVIEIKMENIFNYEDNAWKERSRITMLDETFVHKK
jgi:hypothetical protein